MNANNQNPLVMNFDPVMFELPPLPNIPTPPPRKPGPARAWPAYRTDWQQLMDVEPSGDSPLQDW
jgi:hypothetical protein